MKGILIALVSGLCFVTPAFAADPDPCTLTTTGTATGGGFPGTVLSADFDADGLEDRACVRYEQLGIETSPVVMEIEFGPFDALGYPEGGVTTLERYESKDDIGDRQLFITEPGVYESLCAKGYGEDCGYGEESWAYVSTPSVATGTEGASWMYIYIGRDPADQTQRRFRTFFLSD